MTFNYKLWGSGIIAISFVGCLVFLAIQVTGESQIAPAILNEMIVLLGLAFGWLFGILLSPYSDDEKTKFTEYAQTFGVFTSGYLVSKIDKVVEQLFDPSFLLESMHGFRVMAFISAFLISMIATFIFRRYG